MSDFAGTLLVGIEILLKQIWEKEQSEHEKNNGEFKKHESPQFPPYCHAAEAIGIKTDDPAEAKFNFIHI